MSYDDLEALKQLGIDAILNLCGEYCDLHDIENDYGFEVYYLPIPDESISDTQDLERALAWLDESIYLGKNVLVHCRFGIGRTGTLVTAYLMRNGIEQGVEPFDTGIFRSLLEKESPRASMLPINTLRI